MQSRSCHVKQTLACSLHEVARILSTSEEIPEPLSSFDDNSNEFFLAGVSLVERELIPIFECMLQVRTHYTLLLLLWRLHTSSLLKSSSLFLSFRLLHPSCFFFKKSLIRFFQCILAHVLYFLVRLIKFFFFLHFVFSIMMTYFFSTIVCFFSISYLPIYGKLSYILIFMTHRSACW